MVPNRRLLIEQRSRGSRVNNHSNDPMSRERSTRSICHSREHCIKLGIHLSSQRIAYCEHGLLTYLPSAPSCHHSDRQHLMAPHIVAAGGFQGNLSVKFPGSSILGFSDWRIPIPVISISGSFDTPSHVSGFEIFCIILVIFGVE